MSATIFQPFRQENRLMYGLPPLQMQSAVRTTQEKFIRVFTASSRKASGTFPTRLKYATFSHLTPILLPQLTATRMFSQVPGQAMLQLRWLNIIQVLVKSLPWFRRQVHSRIWWASRLLQHSLQRCVCIQAGQTALSATFGGVLTSRFFWISRLTAGL